MAIRGAGLDQHYNRYISEASEESRENGSDAAESAAPTARGDSRPAERPRSNHAWEFRLLGGNCISGPRRSEPSANAPHAMDHAEEMEASHQADASSSGAVEPTLLPALKQCDPEQMGLVENGLLTGDLLLLKEFPYANWGMSLPSILGVASGESGGLHIHDKVYVSRIFSRALFQVAGAASNPEAVRSAASALERAQPLSFMRHLEPNTDVSSRDERSHIPTVSVESRVSLESAQQELDQLPVGSHMLKLISDDDGKMAHATTLSFTKLPKDMVRISYSNSGEVFPSEFIEIPTLKAKEALAGLMSGESINALFHKHTDARISDISHGDIFKYWLDSKGRMGTSTQYVPGVPLQQRPQKGEDCAIESKFAFLATVLPRSDYKLAKAACLQTLMAMGEMTGDLQPDQKKRLKERIDSAVRGMTTPHDPDKNYFRPSTR